MPATSSGKFARALRSTFEGCAPRDAVRCDGPFLAMIRLGARAVLAGCNGSKALADFMRDFARRKG